MKLSNISTAPYRPQIKRLPQKDLPISQYVNEFDSSSNLSGKKLFGERRSRVSPEPDSSWIYHNNKRKKSSSNKKKISRQICFWIIIAIILLLIIGAIIGIALGLTLATAKSATSSTTQSSSISTTNSTSISTSITTVITTISLICSNTGHGSIAFQNGSIPTTWTSYSYSFTATKSASTLVFGFDTDGTNSFYLDTVSVVNTASPSNQLLVNHNFENSTTIPTGWLVSCELTSCGGTASLIDTSSVCSSGYCFQSFCTNGRAALIFLSQTFATTNSNSYTISFMLKRTNIGSSGYMAFYLDIV